MSTPDILTLLANLMQASGMSHDALSKAAVVRRATVSEILSGKQEPKASTLDALLGVFGYTLAGVKKEWAGSGALTPTKAKKQQNFNEKALLTVDEAATARGVSRPAIIALLRRGRFPGAMKEDGQWRIPTGEVLAFQKRTPGRQPSAAATPPAPAE